MSLVVKTYRAPSGGVRPAVVNSRQLPTSVRHLLLKAEGRLHCVRIDEIDWCQAAGNYVQLHLGTRMLQIRKTLAEVSVLLGALRYTRISRTTIVNLDRIVEVQPDTGGGSVVRLQGGHSVRLTKGYRTDFMERFFVL
jgi:two-component system LytT family response regulator